MSISCWIRGILAAGLCLLCSKVPADVTLPSIFGNHMVLQRGVAVAVWGWADPGEEVTVQFAGQSKQTESGSFGEWLVHLDPLEASDEGRQLQVRGDNRIAYDDVLVGDVWVCSGQSNMEWPLRLSLSSDAEIESAQYPAIRLFDVEGHTTSPLPKRDVPGSWQVCSPDTVPGFSAVGYFFGRHLHRQTGVPIGLLGTNWGGTRIEPWTPPAGFRRVPQLESLAEQVNRFDPRVEQGKETWEQYLEEVEDWLSRAKRALEADAPLPVPIDPPGLKDAGQPTAIYNAMVHPVVPFGIRGAIWYQGESNGGEGIEYFYKMKALIEGWRQVWNLEDFPIYFYFVQLANWQKPNEQPAGGDGWARIREAQRKALTIPHTGMAVTIDIGEADDIHPRNKQDVGQRLARWALRDVYGKEIVVSGPLYRDKQVEGDRIRIEFDHVGRGLMVGEKSGLAPTKELPGGELQGFAIAGSDRQWHWAEAKIDDGAVVVWSPEVPEPKEVRYAYSMNPADANLYNEAGLPASPFRTDDW